MNIDKLIENKLKIIRQKIFSSANNSEIEKELDFVFIQIKNNYQELDFIKKFDQLISGIVIDRVLKDKNYVNGFFKKYINQYFCTMKADVYTAWGILFAKILSSKIKLKYPVVFANFFKIYWSKLPVLYSQEELVFPLEENIDLFEIIQSWKEVIDDLLANSSSYTLIFNSHIRNKLVLYLYDFYQKRGSLNIWFPFAGMGIEQLLISYIFNLIFELENNMPALKNFCILSSGMKDYLYEEGIKINPFKDLFSKTKEDFARENGIKVKDITITQKNARKKMIFSKTDFAFSGQIIDRNFEVIIINSLKYSDVIFFQQKLLKLFNKLSSLNKEILLILETQTNFKIELANFSIGNYKPVDLIDDIFISANNDYFLSYLVFKFQPEQSQEEDSTGEDETLFEQLRKKVNNLGAVELKKMLLKIDKKIIKTSKDYLSYALLLAKARLYNKAYDIVKNTYQDDYTQAYKVLVEIIDNCKNHKIVKRCENFIVEKQIKEQGFAAELLDAIVEEYDKFNDERRRKLEDRDWL